MKNIKKKAPILLLIVMITILLMQPISICAVAEPTVIPPTKIRCYSVSFSLYNVYKKGFWGTQTDELQMFTLSLYIPEPSYDYANSYGSYNEPIEKQIKDMEDYADTFNKDNDKDRALYKAYKSNAARLSHYKDFVEQLPHMYYVDETKGSAIAPYIEGVVPYSVKTEMSVLEYSQLDKDMRKEIDKFIVPYNSAVNTITKNKALKSLLKKVFKDITGIDLDSLEKAYKIIYNVAHMDFMAALKDSISLAKKYTFLESTIDTSFVDTFLSGENKVMLRSLQAMFYEHPDFPYQENMGTLLYQYKTWGIPDKSFLAIFSDLFGSYSYGYYRQTEIALVTWGLEASGYRIFAYIDSEALFTDSIYDNIK